MRFQKLRPTLFIGGNRAEQNIGMTGWIFGRCVDGDIHPEIERLEVKRGGPGIVHHDDGAALVRLFRDSRNVLHLECVRGGRFREHDLGVGAHQLRDAGTDFRIVIFDLHAHALQDRIGKMPGRIVDRIDEQRVIAWRQESEKRNRDGCKAGRHADRARRTFQRIDCLAERIAGRRAARAVGVFLVAGRHCFRIGEKHG